jgi:hypothetical protein
VVRHREVGHRVADRHREHHRRVANHHREADEDPPPGWQAPVMTAQGLPTGVIPVLTMMQRKALWTSTIGWQTTPVIATGPFTVALVRTWRHRSIQVMTTMERRREEGLSDIT